MSAVDVYEAIVASAVRSGDVRDWKHCRSLAAIERNAAVVTECDRRIANLTRTAESIRAAGRF